jgi:sugar phosphate isomerase/epimerase
VISRREVLLALAASPLYRAAGEARRIPVGLQLFSVRKQCAADLPGTLARVKEIGFEGVELAGSYGHTAAEFRQLLDDHALVCCGAHNPLPRLEAPNYQQTVDFVRGVGTKKVIVPGIPANRTQDLTGWRGAAAALLNLEGQLRKDGLEIGYHNHAIEFRAMDGARPIDILLRSAPGVFFELDLGGAGYGGANPIEVLETYRKRVKMIHVKDYTATKPDVAIGTGSMDWPGLLRDAPSTAVEWYVIEHDSKSGPDLSDIADSYQRFLRLQGT